MRWGDIGSWCVEDADVARSAVDISSELARLEGLAILDLRQEWRRLHQTPPPMRLSRDILLRGIAYKLQERVLGGLSKSTLRKLQKRGPRWAAHAQGSTPPAREAIVASDLWHIVQDKLEANRCASSLAIGAKAPSLLTGLIIDGDGNRMTPTHANKRGRRYRYYISAPLLDREPVNTMRVPAGEIRVSVC